MNSYTVDEIKNGHMITITKRRWFGILPDVTTRYVAFIDKNGFYVSWTNANTGERVRKDSISEQLHNIITLYKIKAHVEIETP